MRRVSLGYLSGVIHQTETSYILRIHHMLLCYSGVLSWQTRLPIALAYTWKRYATESADIGNEWWSANQSPEKNAGQLIEKISERNVQDNDQSPRENKHAKSQGLFLVLIRTLNAHRVSIEYKSVFRTYRTYEHQRQSVYCTTRKRKKSLDITDQFECHSGPCTTPALHMVVEYQQVRHRHP